MNSHPRRINILWFLLPLALALVGCLLFQLVGPNSAIVVSRATTYITSPLRDNGLPDYAAHIVARRQEGVTPENNAAPLIWRAMWPGELNPEDQLLLCNALGMEVPSGDESLVPVYDPSVLGALGERLAEQEQSPAEASVDELEEPEEVGSESNEGSSEDEFAAGQNGADDAYGDEDGYADDGYGSVVDVENPYQDLAHAVVDQALDTPWTTSQVPVLAKWAQQNQQPLDLLVEASQRRRYFSPSPSMLNGTDESMMFMLLPDVHGMRTAARALKARAMWHLGEGRAQEAWQDLYACHRLARFACEGTTLVEQLVGIALDTMACSGTATLLHHGNLTADQARRILTDLTLLPKISLTKSLDEGERLLFVDTVLRMATGNLTGQDIGGFAGGAASQLIVATRLDWNLVLRKGNLWYDRMVEATALPTRADRVAALQKIDGELQDLMAGRTPVKIVGSIVSSRVRSELMTDVLLSLLLPAISAATNAEDRESVLLDLTRTAAALSVYRAEHGEYPSKLSDLVPEPLPELPPDIYSTGEFMYSRRGDGYLLYSVFENGQDDSGTDWGGKIINGEWVPQQQTVDQNAGDLVIRLPRPALQLPPQLKQ